MKSQSTSLVLIIIFLMLLLPGCKENSGSLEIANYPCIDGLAKDTFPCENIELYASVEPWKLYGLTEVEFNALTNNQKSQLRLNDIWGWKDPMTNKEYALVGLIDGVSFVDISDPNNPVVIGKLEESTLNAKFKIADFDRAFPACTFGIGDTEAAKTIVEGSTWRDMKVFDNHAFVVSDAQAHGMQVFDLTKLRNFSGEFLTFTHDALYDRFANAHNIVINEETGFAYAVGVTNAEICGSRNETGLHIVDINNPIQPTFAGCFFDAETDLQSYPNIAPGYIHDTQCVVYDGPDSDHRGKELCVSSAEGAVVITDVSDKENPITLGFKGQTQMQYSHQGWLTEDHSYFLMNDELDENNLGRETRTYIWDVRNLENPEFLGFYLHTTTSIDHNLYIKDGFVYQSNYTSGLRAFRIGNLQNLELDPVGYFDTQPALPNQQDRAYKGAWSNYPYFESEVLIVSDIEDGLFILRPDF